LITGNSKGTTRLANSVRKRKEQMFGDRAMAKRLFSAKM
jgi:hypothetical protein